MNTFSGLTWDDAWDRCARVSALHSSLPSICDGMEAFAEQLPGQRNPFQIQLAITVSIHLQQEHPIKQLGYHVCLGLHNMDHAENVHCSTCVKTVSR
ncbi:hypothetical protein JRQ81_012055 [Phrynocephalus forsythii]|uniref:Uncharacterized protein n=1 Tax=Phrynocephalus forsythii TaxID=171643 RepID=A0A9Q0X7A6_9SAUR|nr:hypothetical protein JRQ81_012055 [Phrynocephalus forsythii]